MNVVKKQINLEICIFMSNYLSFVYYQGHFMFEYKCMHVFSKTKCIFKSKCMHVYVRGYGTIVLTLMWYNTIQTGMVGI